MRKLILLAVALIIVLLPMSAFAQSETIDLLINGRSGQYYSNELVPREDIETILLAGTGAQSGHNTQQWFFVAISDPEVMDTVEAAATKPETPTKIHQFGDAPLAIAVFVPEGGFSSLTAGIVLDRMVIAANALGYGAKIVGAHNSGINANRELLGVPEGMSCASCVLIGKLDPAVDLTVDTVTGPSTRKPLEEIANIID